MKIDFSKIKTVKIDRHSSIIQYKGSDVPDTLFYLIGGKQQPNLTDLLNPLCRVLNLTADKNELIAFIEKENKKQQKYNDNAIIRNFNKYIFNFKILDDENIR